jgi:predicted amidohydrolase
MRVSVCQTNSRNDKAANINEALSLLDEAARQGAEIAVLPECVDFMGPDAGVLANAERPGGPMSSALAAKAKEVGIWIVGGTIRFRTEGVRVANTTLVIDPTGVVTARYSKLHMFDISIPGQMEFKESGFIKPGDGIVTSEVAGVMSGLSICYDLRFPELYRLQALAGAKIMFVPAAFTAFTGAAHWELLLRARAVENQCFVVAAGQDGEYMPGKFSFGNSLIIDPWGDVLARAPAGPGVVTADLDFDRLDKVRRELPALQNRRPDIYDLSAVAR